MRSIRIDEIAAAAIPVPAQVIVYVEILGIALTVEFLLTFGGAELYIPDNPKSRGELEAVVGTHNARALAERSYLLQRRVPLAKRWIASVMRASGASVASIARSLRTSDTTVRKWLD